MKKKRRILCIIGPTASGKSARAVEEALARGGEVISVDSRQIYKTLDIGTEKITSKEMCGIPHHLIDIREPEQIYTAGDFVSDAMQRIEEISERGKLPILVGGTHFYFDALLKGLPMDTEPNDAFREELEALPTEELVARIAHADPRRAKELDPMNRRRLIRALELVKSHGSVPARLNLDRTQIPYDVEWTIVDTPRDELRARIDARLASAFARGLVDEVRNVRERVGDARVNELGLEYRIVGQYISTWDASPTISVDAEDVLLHLLPILSAKLWQYARRQKSWLKKLCREFGITGIGQNARPLRGGDEWPKY